MFKIKNNINLENNSFIAKNRHLIVTLIHLIQIVLVSYLAFVLRFESFLLPDYYKLFLCYLPILILIRIIFYLQAGLYKNFLRYSSVNDLIKIIKSATLGSIVFFIVVRFLIGDSSYPISICILDWLLLTISSGGTILFIRIINGNVSEATRIGERLIAASLITRAQMQEALSLQGNKGEKLGAKLVRLGHITEEKLMSFLTKYNGISSWKTISLEDLLQREPVDTGFKFISDFINGKSVMVTGAGGSIGSELCRQIIKYGPSKLILLDRYENSLFKIDLELKRNTGMGNGNMSKNIVTVIGDILDKSTLEHVFSKHKPQIVFHAAAHKHVPLMEDNPIQAVKNNILGTNNVIDASDRHEVENFVMISTDKAVNPTSVMGATKRIAESLTINKNPSSLTKFTAVRFGNVLGSNGSVVTIFKDMLKNGGPIKVTHPEIKRYFMLIPEAVHLVIMAAASGNGGEVFVLDMGEQIKIVELAENLIRLSGFVPHKEIKIEYTGLRPGEKMYEELFDRSENVVPTFHTKIRKAISTISPTEGIKKHISKLERIIRNNSAGDVISDIRRILQNVNSQDHIPEPQLLTNRIWLESGKELVRI